jgi:leucyl aminopeptidase
MQLPISIHKIEELSEPGSHLFLISNTEQLKDFGFDDSQLSYIIDTLENKSLASIHKLTHIAVVRLLKNDESPDTFTNKLRNDGATIAKLLGDEKQERLFLFDLANNTKATLAILDGLISASYRFNKYKTQKDKLPSTIKKIGVASPAITQSQLTRIANVWAANWIARDLVNEMPSAQSAEQLADSAIHLAAQTGFKIKVYNKHQLEGLNFGGLLAVNRGSVNPPTFMLMEWKPDNAINHQPIVIVGKGIVYDTGGINLKTMPGSLDDMKCDMGGAATTIALMAAIAKNKLPVNIIGLVPATDNRPGFNAYVPGDVITMHNGLTVEVMNTDAEGRLILADALSFAKQFNPQLVIDLATSNR